MQQQHGNIRTNWLNRVEMVVLTVSVVVFALNLILGTVKGVRFDWLGYMIPLSLTTLLYSAGIYYRLSGRSANIAMALCAAGGLILFSASLATFNYMLLPIGNGTIDPVLSGIDESLGIYWPSVMAFAADHPIANMLMRLAYMSTLPQLAFLTILLGFSGNQKALDFMSLSLVVSGVIVVVFWGFFPSLGAKCFYVLPQAIWTKVAPVVDLDYANDLIRLGREGAEMVSPYEIRGLIAFPSYHVTLSMVALVASWQVRALFPVFLLVNLLVLPATMIHGGHHFVDPIGGIILYAITWQLVRTAFSKRNRQMEEGQGAKAHAGKTSVLDKPH